MSDQFAKIRCIFLDALERDGIDAQLQYAEIQCAEQPQLRDTILRMVKAHHQTAGILASSVDATHNMPDESDITGTEIGTYKIRELLGEGGMGSVYVAEQDKPVRRKVALKVVKAGMDSRQVLARFDAERQTLALMDHPHIAKVLDAGTSESGRPYFVMELVRGVPITEFCDSRKLTTRQRLELFIKVCQAVQHAHQKGIIHRDIKPSNVLVTLHDDLAVPKVIDFGIAKATSQLPTEHSVYTGFTQMLGTPLYMSPEQAEMNALDIDTRSDVYSLGVLLYELITGTTPFDKETMQKVGFDEMRRMIREVDPPRPSDRVSTLKAEAQSTVSDRRGVDVRTLNRVLRGELDWIAMKAMEKDRTRRYESPNAFAADVLRYLNNETVEACPPSKSYRLRKYTRRNKSVLVTAAVVVMSLLIGTGVSAWQAVEANLQRRVAVEQGLEAQAQREVAILERQNAVEERNSAVQQRKLALSNQYNAEIVSGQTDWQRGNIGGLHRKLVGHLPVQGEEDRRGWEWYYLFSLCHPEERAIFVGSDRLFASWSPDGEYVATAGRIWNARSGECVRQYSTSNILRHPVAWSPDGQKFAWGMCDDDNGIYIWDRGSDTVSSLRGHESSVWCLAWSPDGTQLASGSLDKTVRIWDVAQRSTVRTLPEDYPVTDVDWSPDGDLLAAAVSETGLKIWKPATGELIAEPAKPSGAMRVSWHPDGEQLAVCGNKSWSLLRRTDLSVIREEDHATVGSGGDIAWNPDGTQLAVADGEIVTIWDPADEQPLVTLRGHLSPVNSLAWSPDGTHLVTSDRIEETRIWDCNAPIQPQPISTDGSLQSLAWQNDGQTLIAVSAEDHALSYWNAAEGSRIRIEQPQAEGPVLWSPDRRLLAVRAGTDENPEIQIVDVGTKAVHSVWQGAAQHRLHTFVWSPDAAMLAIETSFDENVDLEFWDVDREQTISRWQKKQQGYFESFGQIQWSNDCTHVAVAARGDVGGNSTVAHRIHAHIVDVATGKRILKHQLGGPIHTGNVTALAWSPGGQALACAGTQGLVEVLDVNSGHVDFSHKPHNAQIDALTWSPDGRRLASASQDVSLKVLAATGGAESLTFPFEKDNPKHLAWSPDGHRLAAATESGTIHVWDAGRGYEFSEDVSRRGELAVAYYQRALPSGGAVERPALQEFLRLAPDTLGFWEVRGHANANLSEYGRAAQEFAKAIGRDLQLSFRPAHHRAFALLGAGDLDAYRDVCASLVVEFRDSDVPSNRGHVAWLCALSPNPPADSNTVLQMARAIHEHGSLDDSGDDQVLTIGASLFRDGQYDAAVGTLTKLAEKLDRGGDATDEFQLACAEYFLALARHQQGHDFQARRHLAEAIRHADAYRHVGQNWTLLVALDALQRETEAALSKPL